MPKVAIACNHCYHFGLIHKKMSRLKIQKNKEKILKLVNENIDLEYNLNVKSMKKIYEKEINAGSKKEPKTVIATFGMWYEYSKDEDRPNDKPIRIERNEIIAIDGKRSDGWRLIKHYTIDDI